MKKIAFIIPFYYKWNNYANVRSNYEFLQKEGYQVDIYSKKEDSNVMFKNYDLVMLHGSGALLTDEQHNECKSNNIPIFSFGWSDPNLFHEKHYGQGDVYLTNDLSLSKKLKERNDKPVYFYNTACDKRHHKDLNLNKETDILVYGAGIHKWVTDRNEVVDNLRKDGFKIKVFGRSWNKHKDTFEFIDGIGLAKEICQAHLLLDVTNGETAWGHRVFESSARGTPVITFNRADTRSMFADSEIIYYNNYNDILRMLNFYLRTPEVMASLLRKKGLDAQKRCYKDHDISVRIKQLVKIIEENV